MHLCSLNVSNEISVHSAQNAILKSVVSQPRVTPELTYTAGQSEV